MVGWVCCWHTRVWQQVLLALDAFHNRRDAGARLVVCLQYVIRLCIEPYLRVNLFNTDGEMLQKSLPHLQQFLQLSMLVYICHSLPGFQFYLAHGCVYLNSSLGIQEHSPSFKKEWICFVLFCFLNRVSACSSDWPHTEVLLPQFPECQDNRHVLLLCPVRKPCFVFKTTTILAFVHFFKNRNVQSFHPQCFLFTFAFWKP